MAKIPDSMINCYIRYPTFEGKEQPDLVRLTKFSYEEVEVILAAGVVRPRLVSMIRERQSDLFQVTALTKVCF